MRGPTASRRPLRRSAGLTLLAAAWACGPTGPAAAVEVLRYRHGGGEGVTSVEGRLLAEDETGAVAVIGPDGVLHLARGQEVLYRSRDNRVFAALSTEAYAQRLLAELPEGFAVYQTPRYVVAYRTSRGFAKWTASTLERLHRAFVAYWRGRGLPLAPPEFPLGVVVHASADGFADAAQAELGQPIGSAVGYYNVKTNRVRMYDLTGAEEARRGRRVSLKEINQMLATPAAKPLVATVVHEATHQAAYNVGLHQRMADLPLWLVEGMAVYFEAPDLTPGRGWRGIGKVNYSRLNAFRGNAQLWGPGALAALVTDDQRMQDPRAAGDAYADAWALTYYLIRYRPDDYVAYVRTQAKKRPLIADPPGARLEEFRRHFGEPAELRRDLLQKMRKLK